MNKIANFPKRMDVWRKYRDEINKTSLRVGSPFSSDKKLSRLVSQINAISPTILKNVSNDLDLSETINIRGNLTDQYKSLSFSINSLNANLLNKISAGIENAENERHKYFLINKDGTLSTDSLEKFKQKNNTMIAIKQSIDKLEYRIQKFPQTAGEDLEALNTVLETIKIKLKDENFPKKIDTSKIVKSTDWTKLYKITFVVLCFAIIGIIISTILLFVL